MPGPEPERGDVYEVDLDPVEGREQGGRRPLLVISIGSMNRSVSTDSLRRRLGHASGDTVDAVAKRAGLLIGLGRSR
jgi:mRNA-degrading endonuclease toxin of MazEF toxin-antitoxin module